MKSSLKKMIFGIVSITTAAAIAAALIFYTVRKPKDMGASYTETSETIRNPERGFYALEYFREGTQPEEFDADLLAMRIGLGEFSYPYLIKAYTGEAVDADIAGRMQHDGYIPISDEFLADLREQLDLCRQTKTPVIMRFAYDDFNGWADCEPQMEYITAHIEQLADIFTEYEDVICCVESGLLGPWGEQHTSEMVTQENINTMLDSLLDAVPESIPVSVRRPSYYAGYVGISEADLADYRADADSPAYRIGIYNDGYLGSSSDLGTFDDRDAFNVWMSYQGDHTLYGSEATVSDDPNYLDWTYVDGVCDEMFLTHTSYLNSLFNAEVLDRWKAAQYQGSDEVYAGKSVYEYVENHLGYRYVLREAAYRKVFHTAYVTLKVENVGAGNAVKERNVSVFVVDENGTAKEFPQEYDVRSWQSGTVSTEEAVLDLSDLSGTCRVYLKLTDGLGNGIRFANEDNEFSEEYGNFCGTIEGR